MATRYWKSTTSGATLNTTTNWTGSGALTNDDLIIDLSNSAAAVGAGVPSNVASTIVSATLSCNSLTVVDTSSKPLTITGSSTINIGSSSGSSTSQQFITTANTIWNHTGTITLQGNIYNPFLISTGGGVIQAPVTMGSLTYYGGIYKLTNLFKTSKTVTFNYGTLDLSNYDLWCGIFSSNTSNATRNIAFGTNGKGIVLDNVATATIFVISNNVTGLTTTGVTKVTVTNSGNLTTKTITSSGYNGFSGTSGAVPFNFYFSDTNKTNSNIIAVTAGSWFLDFNATNWNTAGSFTNSARTIFGNLNLCSGLIFAGTSSSGITTFDNSRSVDGTNIINYNSAIGVGPITVYGSYYYAGNSGTFNFISPVTSVGTLTFSGNSGTIINLNALINCTTITHSNCIVNFLSGSSINGTVYTQSGGVVNFVDNTTYYPINLTGAYTWSGGNLYFSSNSRTFIYCASFASSGSYTSITSTGTDTGTNNLPQQIEVFSRLSGTTISISNSPYVTGEIGFLISYAGTSSFTFNDTSGNFSYTFNTGAAINVSNYCRVNGLDLINLTGNFAISNNYSFYINGSFFDDTTTKYKTSTTGSTNSTPILNLLGGTETNPKILCLQSQGTAVNIIISGAYDTSLAPYQPAPITSGYLAVTGTGYLNLILSNFTVGSFTSESETIIVHTSGQTTVTITGISSTVVSLQGKTVSVSTDKTCGDIVLQAPGSVTTNTRLVYLSSSNKIEDSFNITFSITNPRDNVYLSGLCNYLDFNNFYGTANISNLKCCSYNTIKSPGYLSVNTINIYTDETAVYNNSSTIYLNNANTSYLTMNFYGTGGDQVTIPNVDMSTATIRLYNGSNVYGIPNTYRGIYIFEYSTFTTGNYSILYINNYFYCGKTATIEDYLNITFNYSATFFSGGKNYNQIVIPNQTNLEIYDNPLIDYFTFQGTVVIHESITINNINTIENRVNSTSITFLNTTPSIINLNSITDLSSTQSFYLNTDAATYYPVTLNFNKKLKVGLYSSIYYITTAISKVSSGYNIRNLVIQGAYNSSTETYDSPNFNFVDMSPGTTTANSNKFFLMF